jgi:hypothetical protein
MPVTESAREIALAFGVPPMLLAIPGDNTYANYQEANRAFWRQSVLPLAARIACALTNWLAPAFGDGLVLAADTDRVEALASDRAALWERVSNATFLTVNEKRLATGYGGRLFRRFVFVTSRALGGRRSMTDFVEIFIERGDLAHLALLLWAASASGLAWSALRELTAASRRFDDFVRALQRALRARKAGSAPAAPNRRSPGCPGPLCGPPAS